MQWNIFESILRMAISWKQFQLHVMKRLINNIE